MFLQLIENVVILLIFLLGLSYWLARQLPINEPSKLLLLSINCPTQRLIKGLQILKV